MQKMATAFLEAVTKRRTFYAISSELPNGLTESRIEEIAKTTGINRYIRFLRLTFNVVLHAPSSFNSQSTRVVVLFKKEHDKLWDFTRDALKAIVPADVCS